MKLEREELQLVRKSGRTMGETSGPTAGKKERTHSG